MAMTVHDSGQLETAKAQAYNMKTPPGQMSRPAWKAVPSVDAQEMGGGEVPPGYCIVWIGAQHPEAPLGYQQRLDSASRL